MSRSRLKSRMKVIPGGKQLSLIKDTEEVLKFLEFTAKALANDPSLIEARYQACVKGFSLIREEEDQIGWIIENIPLVLSRQTEISEEEFEKTARLITEALEDYMAWSSDPFGWERRQQGANPEPAKKDSSKEKPLGRTLTFPLRADFCVEVKLPEGGLSTEDFLRLGLFLYPYCNNLDLTKSFSWLNLPQNP